MIKPLPLFAVLAMHAVAFAGGEGWTQDFEAAKKQAATEKKDMLLDFTGSDWCGWCIKLDKEVFQKDEFKKAAKEKYVLVELDFPQDEAKVKPETKKQNEELSQKFGIEGYPSIVLLDNEGRPYASTGYKPGGAETYVKHLDELRAKKTARDEAFAKAGKLEGAAKAKALLAALKELELPDKAIDTFYTSTVEDIKKADPKDETGFAKERTQRQAFATFEEGLGKFAEADDMDGALGHIEKSLKEGDFTAEDKQKIVATKGMIFAHQKKTADAIKLLEEAKALAPESEFGKHIPEIIEQIKNPDKEDEHEGGDTAKEEPKKADDAKKDEAKPAEKK